MNLNRIHSFFLILILSIACVCARDLKRETKSERKYNISNHPPLGVADIPVAIVFENTDRKEHEKPKESGPTTYHPRFLVPLTTPEDQSSLTSSSTTTKPSQKATSFSSTTSKIQLTTATTSTATTSTGTPNSGVSVPEKTISLPKISVTTTTTNPEDTPRQLRSRGRGRVKLQDDGQQIPVAVVYETTTVSVSTPPPQNRYRRIGRRRNSQQSDIISERVQEKFKDKEEKQSLSVKKTETTTKVYEQEITKTQDVLQKKDIADGKVANRKNALNPSVLETTTIVALGLKSQDTNKKTTTPNDKEKRERDPVVPIVESRNVVFSHTGEFHYSFEGGDGTKKFENGILKTSKLSSDEEETAGEAVEGGFSYKDKEGRSISLTYTADENGYRPVGDHLPTPPPVPPAIARALAYLATKTTPAEDVTESIKKRETKALKKPEDQLKN